MSLFAIVHKDTKEILNPVSFRKYWPNYGSNQLYGWRSPKKTYETLGRAKAGFAHIPEKLKSELEIAEFVYSRSVTDGEELMEERRKKKEKRKTAEDKRLAELRLWRAERELEEARAKVAAAQKEAENP